MMWQVKYMVDPGDGLVTVRNFEHASDDICEVASDVVNGQSNLGEFHSYWLFGLEAQPE